MNAEVLTSKFDIQNPLFDIKNTIIPPSGGQGA
jgi:hypothetical protein